ncbi:hypothetical protein ACNKU7_02630 [Microbulbifer sp. SA54]|uniref:hypothetical protein n=1 Tax=Microbulbifer sp. SA54 TaxID=3401577 RepID=UPI003AAFE143
MIHQNTNNKELALRNLFNEYRRIFTAVFALASLVLLSPVVQAAKLKNQNLTQLIQASESIVAGEVAGVRDGFTEQGIPYTEVTINVGTAAKGNHKEGSEYRFRQFGLLQHRTLPNGHKMLAITPEGFPRWTKGEYVLAFMHEKARHTGLQTTAGMAQGKLSLTNGKLSNEFNNAGLFDGVEINSSLLSPEQRNMLSQTGAVDTAAFMDLVHTAVAEDWIGKGEMK